MLESRFNEESRFIKKRLQQRYFLVNIGKSLRHVQTTAFVYLSCCIYYHFPNSYRVLFHKISAGTDTNTFDPKRTKYERNSRIILSFLSGRARERSSQNLWILYLIKSW